MSSKKSPDADSATTPLDEQFITIHLQPGPFGRPVVNIGSMSTVQALGLINTAADVLEELVDDPIVTDGAGNTLTTEDE